MEQLHETDWQELKKLHGHRERVRSKAKQMAAAQRQRDSRGHFVVVKPVENRPIWPLKSKEGQELGILVVDGRAANRTHIGSHWDQSGIFVSLPYVSILHGPTGG